MNAKIEKVRELMNKSLDKLDAILTLANNTDKLLAVIEDYDKRMKDHERKVETIQEEIKILPKTEVIVKKQRSPNGTFRMPDGSLLPAKTPEERAYAKKQYAAIYARMKQDKKLEDQIDRACRIQEARQLPTFKEHIELLKMDEEEFQKVIDKHPGKFRDALAEYFKYNPNKNALEEVMIVNLTKYINTHSNEFQIIRR